MQLALRKFEAGSDGRGKLSFAVLFSITLHALLLCLIRIDPELPEQKPIEVTLLRPPPAVKKLSKAPEQFVSPSDAPEKAPTKETNLRSDKDTAAEAETIARGMPDAGSQPAPKVEPVPPTPPKPETKASTAKAPAAAKKVE